MYKKLILILILTVLLFISFGCTNLKEPTWEYTDDFEDIRDHWGDYYSLAQTADHDPNNDGFPGSSAANQSIETTMKDQYKGNKCLKLYNNEFGTDLAYIVLNLTVPEGETATMSFYYKSTIDSDINDGWNNPDGWFGIYDNVTEGVAVASTATVLLETPQPEWTLFEYVLTAGDHEILFFANQLIGTEEEFDNMDNLENYYALMDYMIIEGDGVGEPVTINDPVESPEGF